MLNMFCSRPVPIFFAFLSIFEHWKLFTDIHPSSPNFASLYELSLLPNPGCIGYRELKSFSDVVLSQQPSPKNYLQKFLSLIFNNLNQIHRDPKKKICKTFFGLGCCDKTALENDFFMLLSEKNIINLMHRILLNTCILHGLCVKYWCPLIQLRTSDMKA